MEAVTLDVPEGAEQTRETLKHMRDLVRMGVADPQMRMLAVQIVRNVGGKKWMAEIRTIFNWVRQNITYRLDAVDVEQIHLAKIVIAQGQGDCDDMCIVLATLLMCIGHTCRFVAVGFGPRGDGVFSHVILDTRGAGEPPWVSLDATEPHPMGWFPPGVTNIMRCPIGMGS